MMVHYNTSIQPLLKRHQNKEYECFTGPGGFMGYGDLWGFIWHDSIIINPGLDLWEFISPGVFP